MQVSGKAAAGSEEAPVEKTSAPAFANDRKDDSPAEKSSTQEFPKDWIRDYTLFVLASTAFLLWAVRWNP